MFLSLIHVMSHCTVCVHVFLSYPVCVPLTRVLTCVCSHVFCLPRCSVTSPQTLDLHPPWESRRQSLADIIPDWPTLQRVRRGSEVGHSNDMLAL